MCVPALVCVCAGDDCPYTPVPDPGHFQLVDEDQSDFVSIFKVHMPTCLSILICLLTVQEIHRQVSRSDHTH